MPAEGAITTPASDLAPPRDDPAVRLDAVSQRFGSVQALDGVSLTVAAVHAAAFEVALIPETLGRTTLGSLAPGRRVNLEVDILAKYVEKLLSPSVEAR